MKDISPSFFIFFLIKILEVLFLNDYIYVYVYTHIWMDKDMVFEALVITEK
jgi:hypothetical protein